jgi:hypothetical protein
MPKKIAPLSVSKKPEVSKGMDVLMPNPSGEAFRDKSGIVHPEISMEDAYAAMAAKINRAALK